MGVVSGVGLAAFIYQWRAAKASLVPELNAGGSETPKVSHRELRYKEFASLVYKGEPYMSARDFLESVVYVMYYCHVTYIPLLHSSTCM